MSLQIKINKNYYYFKKNIKLFDKKFLKKWRQQIINKIV